MYLPYVITFLAYFTIILIIAGFAKRHTHDTEDFVLGGRRLGYWIVAMGAGASDMSGWLLLALPGLVYVSGMNQFWMPLGLSIGAFINWTFVAKRLRVYTEVARNSLTIPAFFENRFRDESGILRLVTSIAVIVFFMIYVSSGFVSGAVLFQSTFDLSYHSALLIGAVVIITYTCVGGFLAVNWIDLLQGSLMWIALLTVPAVTLYALLHMHGNTQPLHDQFQWVFSSHKLGLIGIFSLLAWGLGYFGQPHILVRFMAINDKKKLVQSTIVCMTWMVMSLIGALFVGFFAHYYFAGHPLADPESAFLQLAKELFNPYIAGVLMAAVLSAVMSAVAAQLLASSSSLAEDVYARFIQAEETDRQGLLFNRLAVLIIAGAALFLARDPHSTVLNLVSYAWAGLGASFGPLILCCLFWKRATRNGAIAGIIMGGVTVIVWKNLAHFGGIFSLYELCPAFILSLLSIIIVSLLDKKPGAEVIEQFNQFKKTLAT